MSLKNLDNLIKGGYLKIEPMNQTEFKALQAWQVKAIEKSVKKANSKKAKFIDHEKVADWLNSWGSDKEKAPLK